MDKKDIDLGGRPKALVLDKQTLATIRGLGRIQATTRECAAFLGVAHSTFIAFKKEHPIVEEVLEQGKLVGKASLRRRQLQEAEKGNTTMLVWCGKQYLEQKDKHEVAQKVDVTVTDARSKLEHLIDRRASSSGEAATSKSTH